MVHKIDHTDVPAKQAKDLIILFLDRDLIPVGDNQHIAIIIKLANIPYEIVHKLFSAPISS